MGIIKDILYKISAESSLPLFKKQTIFPYYHIVRDDKVAHIENLYHYKNVTQFKSDLKYLLQQYKPLNPRDLWGKMIPANSFLLTFDDGLEEIYSIIYPILKENNVKAIFFINPNFVDNRDSLYKHDISVIISHLKNHNYNIEMINRINSILSIEFTSATDFITKLKNTKYSDRNKINDVLSVLNIDMEKYLAHNKPYISSDQIRQMISDGFYFGGHTMSHPPLGQLTFENQKDEIINSINWLKEKFGIKYSLFAFPFSDKGITRKLLDTMFEYDKDIFIFGNSGLKKDIDKRIIQRFSLENPFKQTRKQIVTENLYKIFNKTTGKYNIKRNDRD